MNRPTSLVLVFVLCLACPVIAACGDNQVPETPPPADAAVDADPSTLAPCLDRPTDLPRPPATGALPCELLPPGFVAPRP
jgi:hypothetical protein